MSIWSTSVRRFLTKPANSSKNISYNLVGEENKQLPCITNSSRLTDCKVKILLLFEDGIVKEARAECFCDPAGVSSANWLMGKIKGKSLDEIRSISAELMAKELEIGCNSLQFTRCQSVMSALSVAISMLSDRTPVNI